MHAKIKRVSFVIALTLAVSTNQTGYAQGFQLRQQRDSIILRQAPPPSAPSILSAAAAVPVLQKDIPASSLFMDSLKKAFRAANKIDQYSSAGDQVQIRRDVQDYYDKQWKQTLSRNGILQGQIDTVDFLRQVDQRFQAEINGNHKATSIATFHDLMPAGDFCGNPILIRLDPPDDWTAKLNLKQSLNTVIDADKDIQTLEKAAVQVDEDIKGMNGRVRSSTDDLLSTESKRQALLDSHQQRVDDIASSNRLILSLETKIRDLQISLSHTINPKQKDKLRDLLSKEQELLFQAQSSHQKQLRALSFGDKSRHISWNDLARTDLLVKEIQKSEIDDIRVNEVEQKHVMETSSIMDKLISEIDKRLKLDAAKYCGSNAPIESVPLLDSTAEDRITYLLVLNYNIPALAPQLAPCKYRSARYASQLQLRWFPAESAAQYLEGADSNTLSDELLYRDVAVESIYPKNLVLDANFSNSKSWTATAQPEWAGISAGSVQYQNTDNIAYAVNFPTVVGSASQTGALQWVFYPAKVQNISFGNQSALVVFPVPKKYANSVLQLNNSLEYQFKYFHLFPWPFPSREYKRTYVPLNQALYEDRQIELFKRTYGRTLSMNDQIALERILRLRDPIQIAPESRKPDPQMVKVDVPTPGKAAIVGSATAGIKPSLGNRMHLSFKRHYPFLPDARNANSLDVLVSDDPHP